MCARVDMCARLPVCVVIHDMFGLNRRFVALSVAKESARA